MPGFHFQRALVDIEQQHSRFGTLPRIAGGNDRHHQFFHARDIQLVALRPPQQDGQVGIGRIGSVKILDVGKRQLIQALLVVQLLDKRLVRENDHEQPRHDERNHGKLPVFGQPETGQIPVNAGISLRAVWQHGQSIDRRKWQRYA